ncbi:MAG: capsular exopolysaccharide family [Herbinix sp.]|jgi:capsular exopolysaccharide synthesis family protein|nr:capsular exopolysaccharide family [Herbinix sp.]
MAKVNFEKLQQLDARSNEAYKSLRTNIQFCGDDVHIIGFTSCLPNEGKSSVSFQLAASFGESGKKVVFIDADLRKSVIMGRYKPDHAVKGLAHYLSGQITADDIIYTTNIPNVDVIFPGPVPPNPVELLGNDYFAKLIAQLRKTYDYVIIDSPPLGSVIDSAIVGAQCDGIILIIEVNAISTKIAQKVKSQLERGNLRILGVVMNKHDSKLKGYYGKGYYGKY